MCQDARVLRAADSATPAITEPMVVIGGPVTEWLILRMPRAEAAVSADGGVVGGPVSTPVTALVVHQLPGCRIGCGHCRLGGGEHVAG